MIFFSCFHNYVSKNALLGKKIMMFFFSCFHNYISKKCIARHVLFSHFQSQLLFCLRNKFRASSSQTPLPLSVKMRIAVCTHYLQKEERENNFI